MSVSWRLRISCLTPILIIGGLGSGCGMGSTYPETSVRSPIGRPGTCIVCAKTIPSVEAKNLVTVDGIQFQVCDDGCAVQAVAQAATAGHNH
ncbi:MAG: hypothetical protein SFV23_20050 [Planctomycetaceae bacterium]|nr:hypothetical protein [Planctomycetaceae bacterium]